MSDYYLKSIATNMSWCSVFLLCITVNTCGSCVSTNTSKAKAEEAAE